MKINTRDFGEMEITENSVITFVQPLYGFEDYKNFIIIQNDEVEGIAWLQSVETPDLCFIMASPEIAVETESYSKYIPESDFKKISADSVSDFECWLVMVVKDDLRKSTVNLKSPVIINPEAAEAMQIILDEDFPVRYCAFEERKENKK